MVGAPDQPIDFFISRAGADAALAAEIGRILEDDGKRVILQQWDFANRNFMERMQASLESGARVIALLSNEYLASDHCAAEWLNVIAHDPLNKQARLIVIRVNECTPKGLLTALAYWDLVPIRTDAIRYPLDESGRDDLIETDAQAIAEELGCLPLALFHAAAYLRKRKNKTAVAYLENVVRRMREAPREAEYSRAVFATFQEAADDAEAEATGARDVLALSAFYAPDAIPEELFQQPPQCYSPTMSELVADSWLMGKRWRLTDADSGSWTG